MTRSKLAAAAAAVLTLGLAACGEEGIEVNDTAQIERGAQLFAQRCSGCHTFAITGSEGSAVNVHSRERTDGPSFDDRPESVDTVLYAIRNGGFSGAIMPQNIVVGEDAQAVAEFVAKYAGPGKSE